jgi:hypothetical protein
MADSVINIVINTMKSGFGDKDTKSALKELSSGFQSVTGLSLTYAGALTAAVAVGKKFIDWAKEAESEANNFNIIAAKQDAILKSTGDQVDMTGNQLMDMAEKLSRLNGIEDDNVINAQSLMLTYQNIGGSIFPKAIQTAIDMSTTFGGLESSSKSLGMALNDPVGSLTKLQKAGIKFSDDQKELIQNFVDTNQIAQAQEVILDAVNAKVGGTAAAMNTASDGSTDLKNAQKNLNEVMGEDFVPIARAWNEFWAGWDNHMADNKKSTNEDSLAMAAWSNSLQYELAAAKASSQDELFAVADGTSEAAKIFIKNYEDMMQSTDNWAKTFVSAGDTVTSGLLSEEDAIAAVKAGISGTLLKAEQTYAETTKDLTTEQDKLTESLKWQKDVYAEAPQKIIDLKDQLALYKEEMLESGNTSGDLATKINKTQKALDDEKNALAAGPGAIAGLNNSLDENKTKQEQADEAIRKTTADMIYQQIASHLDSDAQLELGHHMGILSDADYNLYKGLELIINKYPENDKGLINNADSMRQATQEAENYYDGLVNIFNLPAEKTIQLNVVSNYSGVPYTGQEVDSDTPRYTYTATGSSSAGEKAANGGTYTGVVSGGKYQVADSKATGGGFSYTSTPPSNKALGGLFGAGEVMMVGEKGPEPVVFNQPGQVYPTGSLGGNVTIIVNGAGDPDAVANKVMQKIRLQRMGK